MTNPLFLFDYPFRVGETFRLDGDEGRHASTVKRMRKGELIDVANGLGLRAHCIVMEVGKNFVELAVEHVVQESQPVPRIIAVQALAKGDRADLALEALTEVGVDEIVPWSATHSIVKWEDPAKALQKWKRTISEATKQSRRAWTPVLHDVHSTEQVIAFLDTVDCALVLHESAEQSIAKVNLATAQSIALIVGPEGGISPHEIQALQQANAEIVRMGPTVMRTSTAGAVAAVTILSRTNRWA